MFNLIVTYVGSKNFKGPSIEKVCNDLISKGVNNDVEALFYEWKKSINDFKENAPNCFAKDMYKGSLWSA